MKQGLLIISFLLVQASMYACGGLTQQAQCAQLRYSFVVPSGSHSLNSALTCNLEATMYFDIQDTVTNDSIIIGWGDGTTSSIFAVSIAQDTQQTVGFAGLRPLFKHIYTGVHTYAALPQAGYYTIYIIGQYRLDYLTNINKGLSNGVPFYIETQAVPDTTSGFTNRWPEMAPASIKYGSTSNAFIVNPNVGPDPDGDSLVFTPNVPLEDAVNEVPLYMYPDAFCNKYHPNTSSYTMDPHTGEVNWSSPCYQGIFTISTKITKYRHGKLMGSILRDQNLYVSTATAAGIEETGLKPELTFTNPVGGSITGTINNLTSTSAAISIYTIDGRSIMNDQAVKNGTLYLNVAPLAQGLYFLQLKDGVQISVHKFIKL